jgi:undecaprenyl-diphosphatase
VHDLIASALLGTIQGLTEFLPVSSTAHLLIGSRLLRFDDPDSVFTIVIQFGSILAVMWLYRARLMALLSGLGSGDPRARRFALALAVAFLPAAVAGFFFGDFIKGVLHQSPPVIATALIVGGLIMLVVERRPMTPTIMRAEEASLAGAFGVGVCQTLALVPGVSRSGATIVGGLLMRFDRSAAAEFSFFLAMPTMAAAFAKDLWDVRHALSADRAAEIGVGFAMAFIAAFIVVRPFLRVVARSGFAPFAWYRIAAGAAVLGALAVGWM